MKKMILIGTFAVASVLVLLSGSSSFADEKMMMGSEHKMTKEDRAQMADHMEKMAACLRSDKPMKQCHKEAMAACKKEGKHECKMGEMGHHGMMESEEGEDGPKADAKAKDPSSK